MNQIPFSGTQINNFPSSIAVTSASDKPDMQPDVQPDMQPDREHLWQLAEAALDAAINRWNGLDCWRGPGLDLITLWTAVTPHAQREQHARKQFNALTRAISATGERLLPFMLLNLREILSQQAETVLSGNTLGGEPLPCPAGELLLTLARQPLLCLLTDFPRLSQAELESLRPLIETEDLTERSLKRWLYPNLPEQSSGPLGQLSVEMSTAYRWMQKRGLPPLEAAEQTAMFGHLLSEPGAGPALLLALRRLDRLSRTCTRLGAASAVFQLRSGQNETFQALPEIAWQLSRYYTLLSGPLWNEDRAALMRQLLRQAQTGQLPGWPQEDPLEPLQGCERLQSQQPDLLIPWSEGEYQVKPLARLGDLRITGALLNNCLRRESLSRSETLFGLWHGNVLLAVLGVSVSGAGVTFENIEAARNYPPAPAEADVAARWAEAHSLMIEEELQRHVPSETAEARHRRRDRQPVG